jgi:hypothetical protein
MSELKQTKGYLNITGVIVGLNNKEIKEYPKSKEISFGIMTRKDNLVFVKATGFLKNDDDTILVEYFKDKKKVTEKAKYVDRYFLPEGQVIIGTKIKKDVKGSVEAFVDVDAVDEIKNNFKDGDVVSVGLTTECDTYYKNLKLTVTRIYKSSKKIDFTKANFEEENNGRQWIAFSNVNDDELVGYSFNKKMENVKLAFKMDKEFLSAEDFKEFKTGQNIQIEFEYNKVPQYEEVVEEEPKKEEKKYKAKGKYANKENDGYTTYRNVKGYEEFMVVTGITDATDDCYTLPVGDNTTEVVDEEIPF